MDRDAIAHAFRAGRALALGYGTVELVPDREDARLHIPGRDPLDLFGENQVSCFRLLVAAAQRGAPGVKTGELLGKSSSGSLENMFSPKRWNVVSAYVENIGFGRWQLRTG